MSPTIKWALGFYFLCFLSVYIILQLNYRVAEIDDTAWVSYAYNLLHRHITYDLIDGSSVISSGIQYFGKIYALILGGGLSVLGWTRSAAHFLSLFFLESGIFCWYFVLRRFQYSRELSATFCVTGLLFDPFFSAATFSRTESFVFLTSSLALLLLIYGWFFVSMVVAWVGMETHPTGAFAFFLMAAVYFSSQAVFLRIRPVTPQKIISLFGGIVGGFCLFLFLHADVISQLPGRLLQSNHLEDHQVQNFLFDYFFHSKYHRHLLELAVLMVAFVDFFKKKLYRIDPLVVPLTFSLVAFSLVFRRPNFHYALFFYPVFLLVLSKVLEVRGKLVWLILGSLFLLLPQYALAYYVNRGYDYGAEIQNCRKIIPNDSLPILGAPNDWFAFPGRDFYFSRYDGDFAKLGLTRFYLISDDNFRDKPNDTTRYIETHFTAKPIGDFSMERWKFLITLEERLDLK